MTDLEQLERERQEIETGIKEARLAGDVAALRALRERLAELPDREFHARLTAARAAYATARERLARAESRIEPARQELDDTTANHERLKELYRSAETERATAYDRYHAVLSDCQRLREEAAAAQDTVDQLESDAVPEPEEYVDPHHREATAAEWRLYGMSGPRPA